MPPFLYSAFQRRLTILGCEAQMLPLEQLPKKIRNAVKRALAKSKANLLVQRHRSPLWACERP